MDAHIGSFTDGSNDGSDNEMTATEVIPFAPQPNDVICSNRKWIHHHPGNVHYCSLVKKFAGRTCLSKGQLLQQVPDMVNRILESVIHERHGRFLRPTDASNGMFCEMLSWRSAELKVEKALRNCLSRQHRQRREPSKRGLAIQLSTRNKEKVNLSDNRLKRKSSSRVPPRRPKATYGMIPFAPNSNDVVATVPSSAAINHPGNEPYLHIVRKYARRLAKVERPAMREHYDMMIDKILDKLIHQRKGRFLKQSSANKRYCTVMSEDAIREKVYAALHRQYLKFTPPKVDKTRCNKTVVSNAKIAATRNGAGRPNSCDGDDGMTLSNDDDDDDEDDDEDDSLSSFSNSDMELSGCGCTAEDVKPSRATAPPTPRPASCHFVAPNKPNTGTTIANHISNKFHGYGTPQEEVDMREWLHECKLPQLVGNILLSHGARNIEDVLLLIESQPDTIKGDLATLDFVKLQRAADARKKNDDLVYI